MITGNRRTEALRSVGRLLALSRTVTLALSVPRDRTSLRVFGEALGGVRWVLVERRPVPAIEAGLASLDGPQRRSTARRYVG